MKSSIKVTKQVLLLINTLYFEFSSDVIVHFNGYFLQNKRKEKTIDASIQIPRVWEYFGKIFKNTLIDRVYFMKTIPFTTLLNLQNETSDGTLDIEMIFNFLWFVKDNSCNASALAVYCDDEYYMMSHSSKSYSNAEGLFVTQSFTIEEVQKGMDVLSKYNSLSTSKIVSEKVTSLSVASIARGPAFDIEYNEHARVERSMNFLKQARKTSLLPEKISFYVLMLECLFAPKDKTEIQYKLSDRISLYIGDGNIERHYIYELVKDGYNLRSRYVHGDELDKPYKTNASLKKLSKNLDELVRKILYKVIMTDSDIFNMPSGELSKWFNEQKFGSL